MLHWIVSGAVAAMCATAGAWIFRRYSAKHITAPLPDIAPERLGEELSNAKSAASESLGDVLDRVERASRGDGGPGNLAS